VSPALRDLLDAERGAARRCRTGVAQGAGQEVLPPLSQARLLVGVTRNPDRLIVFGQDIDQKEIYAIE